MTYFNALFDSRISQFAYNARVKIQGKDIGEIEYTDEMLTTYHPLHISIYSLSTTQKVAVLGLCALAIAIVGLGCAGHYGAVSISEHAANAMILTWGGAALSVAGAAFVYHLAFVKAIGKHLATQDPALWSDASAYKPKAGKFGLISNGVAFIINDYTKHGRFYVEFHKVSVESLNNS